MVLIFVNTVHSVMSVYNAKVREYASTVVRKRRAELVVLEVPSVSTISSERSVSNVTLHCRANTVNLSTSRKTLSITPTASTATVSYILTKKFLGNTRSKRITSETIYNTSSKKPSQWSLTSGWKMVAPFVVRT